MGDVEKGYFVEYTVDSEGVVDTLKVKTLASAEKITACDDETVSGDKVGNAKDLADKYALIGVNVKDVKGVTVSKLKTADDDNNAVIFYDSSEEEVTAIFLASNNKMVASSSTTDSKVYFEKTVIEYTSGSGSGNEVVCEQTFTADPVEAGQPMTITVTRTQKEDPTQEVVYGTDSYQLTLTGNRKTNVATANNSATITFTYDTTDKDAGLTLKATELVKNPQNQ